MAMKCHTPMSCARWHGLTIAGEECARLKGEDQPEGRHHAQVPLRAQDTERWPSSFSGLFTGAAARCKHTATQQSFNSILTRQSTAGVATTAARSTQGPHLPDRDHDNGEQGRVQQHDRHHCQAVGCKELEEQQENEGRQQLGVAGPRGKNCAMKTRVGHGSGLCTMHCLPASPAAALPAMTSCMCHGPSPLPILADVSNTPTTIIVQMSSSQLTSGM